MLAVALLANLYKFGVYAAGRSNCMLIIVPLAAAAAAFCLFGASLLRRCRRLLSFTDGLTARQMTLILLVTLAAGKILLVFLLDHNILSHEDMRYYLCFAQQIADTGVITDGSLYARLFPYTAVYGLFLSPFVKLFGTDPKVATVLMSIMLTLASVMLFDLIRPYAGKNKAFWGILLYHLLPIGMFQSLVVIHESALLFFSVTALWLLQRALREDLTAPRRVALLLLSGLSVAFGARLNLGGFVVMIAIILYVTAKLLPGTRPAKVLLNVAVTTLCYALCAVTVFGSCAAFLQNGVIQPADRKEANERIIAETVPLAWTAYLGANEKTGGRWNLNDWDTYRKYYAMTDAQQAREYQIDLVRDRAASLAREPVKLLGHVARKTTALWGITFLGFEYGGSGNHLNDFLLYAGDRAVYKGIRAVCYVSNILIYTLMLFSCIRRRKNASLPVTPALPLKLIVIGVALALVPFEMSNKYVSHLHLLLMAIAVLSCGAFMENSDRLRGRLFKQKRKNQTGRAI